MGVFEWLTSFVESATEEDSSAVGTGLTFLAAAIAALLVLPLGWLVVDVFNLGPRAVELTVNPTTFQVLLRSIALVTVVTLGSIVVGVPLAVLTVQAAIPFRRFWTVVSALPLAIPSYLGAFAVVSAFGPRGAFSRVLAPIGIEQIPTVYGFTGAAVVLVFYTYPYVFLTTRASLLSMDASLVEAARTLNTGRWEAFRRVTLPQITPGIAAGALLVSLYTLSDFGTPNIMRVEVFTQFIYARYNAFMRDYAALLSLQLFAVTAVILAIESRIGVDESGAYASSANRGAATLDLGRWRYPAMLVPAGIGLVAIVLPVGIFAIWLLRTGPGYATGSMSFSWSYGLNSVYVAVLAAAGAIVVALPIALRSAVSDSRLAKISDRAPYIGYATPGIVLAIALVSFSLDVVPALYKTIPLLVFAYVVRFMPQAIGSIRTSTLQVDQRLTEAARTLGRSRFSAFREITFPLIVPGIATGAALVFLTTMKELPATLILRPLRFDTLVTYIWRVQEAGLYGKAAIPALVLVVVSGISMAVILAQAGGRSPEQ
ncbi:ABC-type Fe3+ transport system, permease component [Halanaeroarchaeum sp. HSR-CO]|uniref:ABC transporter permease n=1 Tax=Halanaeroarchaeum sp. HSR-CO TaxID=2866382 RepID=UPI00217E579A|nr:iron ABC transporter permease [Halanaeroarchaeum sp. HSR-CO]UWG47855.1 ABC-type Fe3+ transport system, permease component [Halanaeroarchaeum sp. HSR-CO]